jgi:hypothetical protein
MPLIGGGGAGNTAGSNPTGTSSGLNFVGESCYAFSGSFGVLDSAQTLLEFDTGNKTIKATIGCCGPVNPASIGAGSIGLFRIYLNGLTVAQVKIGSSDEAQPCQEEQTIIIPPYTTVKVDNIDLISNDAWKIQAYLTGTVLED